jgi:hypothetical protein
MRPFLVFDIRPDTGVDLPDIQPDTGYKSLIIHTFSKQITLKSLMYRYEEKMVRLKIGKGNFREINCFVTLYISRHLNFEQKILPDIRPYRISGIQLNQ